MGTVMGGTHYQISEKGKKERTTNGSMRRCHMSQDLKVKEELGDKHAVCQELQGVRYNVGRDKR